MGEPVKNQDRGGKGLGRHQERAGPGEGKIEKARQKKTSNLECQGIMSQIQELLLGRKK